MTEVKFTMAEGCQQLAPAKAHADDAGYDLRSREELVLAPGERALVKTGLFLQLPTGFEAQVRPRSGWALKHGITVVNAPGTVDAGYRGEVGVILLNTDSKPFPIVRGDRIAQMVIQRLPEIELVEVTELEESHRGAGGFGSTGKVEFQGSATRK